MIDNLAVLFSCATMIWLSIAIIRRNRARLREDKSRNDSPDNSRNGPRA